MRAENVRPHALHEDRAWPPWLSAAPAGPGTPQALSKCSFPAGHAGPFSWAAGAEQGCCGPSTHCGTAPHPSKERLTLLYHFPLETSSPGKDLGIHLSSNKTLPFPSCFSVISPSIAPMYLATSNLQPPMSSFCLPPVQKDPASFGKWRDDGKADNWKTPPALPGPRAAEKG